MSLAITTTVRVVATVFGLFILQRYLRTKNPSRLPPGPKGLPLIGNVADMPSNKEWETYAEWGRKWGGICYVTLMGQPLYIVNSADIMNELDKQGAIYADRPVLQMGGELLGYKDTLVLLRYGSRFRSYRKYFSSIVGPAPLEDRKATVAQYTHRFLQRVAANPDKLLPYLRKMTGGVILKITYGIEVQEGEDPFVNLIEKANSNFNAATIPGAFLVDSFPLLRRLPEWLPGMGFMKTAREWAQETVDVVEVPYTFTKKQIASGSAPPSFISDLVEDEERISPEQLYDIKWAASSMYGGGADTTVSTEYAFFLAMVLHPDVQKKAQAEIDAVVGNNRLPTFSDRPNLPYINAVVSEVFRWNSVVPLGVPHMAMEDTTLSGYHVPKGSIIMTNLWFMMHDPETYPDPYTFDPSRHIATPERPAQRDPRNICFGHGRRICPGMYMAEASVYSLVSSSLAVFDISKAVENGVEITPIHRNTSGTISYPEPFKCSIKPRSEKAVLLINEERHL